MADIKVSALDAADDIDPEDLFLVIKPASPNNLMTHATGEQLRDFCGGGLFLSANTARVDPSGDDAKGAIGDLGKPFLTVQAVVDAVIALGSNNIVIDIANNELTEDVVTPGGYKLTFIGDAGQSRAYAFNSITFTGVFGASLNFINCSAGNITAGDGGIFIDLQDAYLSDVTATGAGSYVTLAADFGGSEVGDVTATGQIILYGLSKVGTLSSPGSEIDIFNCRQTKSDSDSLATIDSVGSAVFATGSLIQEVTNTGILTLKDSRVVGTNNATSTVYADVLLNGQPGSIDFGARTLYGADGSEIMDWSASPISAIYVQAGFTFNILGSGLGYGHFDSTGFSITDSDGVSRFSAGPNGIYVDSMFNGSGDGENNIDLLNRKLYAADGTTVVLDYSSNGGSLTLDASGFNGNLTTTDNTLQEVAQKVDDLVIGASGAPTSATYITQTHDATLSAEQALGDLASGLMQVTATTGVITSTLTPTIASATVTDSVNGIALQTAGAGKSTLKAATTNASNTSFAMPFIASGSDTIVSKTSTDTLTNKTLTAPSISTATVTDTVNGIQFQTAGAGISFVKAATSQAFNSGFALPTLSGAGNDTLVSKTSTDTLTNKTLTSPTLTAPVLGTPASGVATNLTGTAAGLTAGNVTTNANLTGDVTSTGNATTVGKINATSLAGLATGILKNTTTTGVPSIAVAGTDYNAPGADASTALTNIVFTKSVTGVSLTATGLTDIFTVPTGKTFMPASSSAVMVVVTSTTGNSFTTTGQGRVQDSDGNLWSNATAFNSALTAANKVQIFSMNLTQVALVAGKTLRWNTTTGNSSTTLVVTVFVTGFYF